MVLFNYATKELTAKIVYYGPGLGGKTTNLEHIHKSLPAKAKGKMLSLATQTDRTLFFDFLPMDLGTVKGMKTRVQLYTVPGQVFYDATRKLVLKGADGVVFVVDSQNEMLESNLDSWDNMKHNLMENGLDINAIPLVIQYNKRDLPNVMPVKDLNKKINVAKAPYFEAIAITGVGVQETLKGVAKIVLQNLSRKYAKEEIPEEEVGRIEAGWEIREEEKERVPEPVAAGIVSPPIDLTLDLAALEEIKDLPHVEELETSDDSAITLEPVQEVVEEVPAIGELEDVPELHPEEEVTAAETQQARVKDIPIREPAAIPTATSRGTRKPSVSITDRLRSIETEVAALQNLEESKSKQHVSRDLEPAIAEAVPTPTSTVTASSSPENVSIPIEVTVGKEGQEVKFQISINLKIRILPE